MNQVSQNTSTDRQNLSLETKIKQWGKELGFADVGISDCDLSDYEPSFFDWLAHDYHGEMAYMSAHGSKRTRPDELVPGTVSMISVRMNYFDQNAENALQQLHQSDKAYVSRYALGKDYHKLLRKRLQQLAEKISQVIPELEYRAFTDSAPVLEQAIAHKAGLGFIGKNSLIIHPNAGSWFFLGELYLNIPLAADATPQNQGCGNCTACITECPTQAIMDSNQIDARRCISYLTIEYNGMIPEALRAKFGNRIYGCDDCQLVCPWNRFAQITQESGFRSQFDLDKASLLDLWQWDEAMFLKKLEGSPIRRIGFEKWQRNLAVALGNLQDLQAIERALPILLKTKAQSLLVTEHLNWALSQLQSRQIELRKFPQKTLPAGKNGKHSESIKPSKTKKYYYPANRIRRINALKNL